PEAGRGGQGRDGKDLPVAAHAGRQGSRSGSDALLRAVRVDRAVAEDEDSAAVRPRAPAVERGSGAHQYAVGVHPLRVLLRIVPDLLVDPLALSLSRVAAAGLLLARRQPR